MAESYKMPSKKKNIIIAVIVTIFALAAIAGTVAFISTRGTASAAEINETGTSSTVPGETQNSGESSDNGENVAIPGEDNQNGGNIPGVDADNNTNNNAGTNANTNTNANANVNGTGAGNAQEQEFTQTVIETTTQITEEPWQKKSIGWVPKTVALSVDGLDINKTNLEIRKTATVNDDAYVTTVWNNDIITYKIYVKNIGKINAESVRIYDNVPAGTEIVNESIDNNGILSQDGEIYWKIDVKAGEEAVVSYKVKVLLDDSITQIDNTAKVNGENTNTTHNPKISVNKEVKVVTTAEAELDNQIVAPGTRLRYYINLINNTEFDGVTRVTDVIPEGTSLYNNTISEGGELGENNTIIWKNVSVPAGQTTKVYFDVTVNSNRNTTISNIARVGAENIANQNEGYTNIVKTPVFEASKESTMNYNSNTNTPKLHETNEVEYVVTVTNSADASDNYEANLTGIAKLADEIIVNDLGKMTFKCGLLVIRDEQGAEISSNSITEAFLGNIEITLGAGQTATLAYTYTINEMQNPNIAVNGQTKVEWDEITNNLYWAESDKTEPIDTVVIHVEEENVSIEAIKEWNDYNNTYNTRPIQIILTLYKDGVSTGENIQLTESNNWRAFTDYLRKTDDVGVEYNYTLIENALKYYKQAAVGQLDRNNNTITITNNLDQLYIAEKTSSKNNQTVKEKADIDYTITVYSIGDEDGTISIRDSFKDNDAGKVTFKSGVLEYYDNSSDTQPSDTQNINEAFLNNKITLNIKGNGKAVIKYTYTANVINENKTPDNDGIIRDSVTNELFWAEENDDRYPTDEAINTVTVNVEKEYTSIVATKIWDDAADTSNRPQTITFTLQKNGVDTQTTKTLSSANAVSNDANTWKVTFNNLPKYSSNGTAYNYTVKEDAVEHYIAKYSEDKLTVTNMTGENIEAKVITTNANIPTVPMDVVFVVDISSSMLSDSANNSTNTNDTVNGSKAKTNRIDNSKAEIMVDAVNKAIDKVIKSNSNNRVAVQLFNSKVEKHEEGYEYYLIELDKYNANANGKYIEFSWGEDSERYWDNDAKINKFHAYLTTDVTSKTGEHISRKGKIIGSHQYGVYAGTYTQAGIQKGEGILLGAANNSRIPVMILVTDGIPTHYNPNTVGQYNPDGTPKIIDSGDTGNTTYPRGSGVGSRIAYESKTNANYYYYTMLQLEASKKSLTNAYSRECRLYTIGVGLKGSMAEAMLTPETDLEDYILNHLDDPNNTYKHPSNYKAEQKNLKNLLLENDPNDSTKKVSKIKDYINLSFNIQNPENTTLLDNLNNAFLEVINDSTLAETTTYIGEERKLALTEIALNKPFKLVIDGTDYNDNPITADKSYTTFSEAYNDDTLLINGSKIIKKEGTEYYIDLSSLKTGNMTVTYVRDNQI